MSILKRLQRLTGDKTPGKKESIRADEISELRRRIEAITSRRPAPTVSPPTVVCDSAFTLKDLIQGDVFENIHGNFFVADSSLAVSSYHGCRCMGEISTLDMNTVALLANNPDLASFNYVDALFLDTETTGLSGGTGTLAFLIGLGWFENETFVTRQIFARDFSEERASLSFLLEVAEKKNFIVSFNGKAFDVGLLSTRFILNRLPDKLSSMPHLDLLHPSRRLLRHRLDNNRLITIENEILGFRRSGDIPGSEIPQRYFDWLRNRDARFMADVFEHNRLDVISMATLSIHLAEMLKFDRDITSTEHSDILAVARLLLDRRDQAGARILLEALINSEDPPVAFEARRILSLIHKRSGSWHDAVCIWEMMLLDDPGSYFAAAELAKWYEHRKHDYEKAIEHLRKRYENIDNIAAFTAEERNIQKKKILEAIGEIKSMSPQK